ncbi:MAG TPA: hypothetical protein VJ834_14585 [Burkholderiales bacterium]|nr:hypothetical protein [Burkholderiales bacterium]
MRQDHPELLGEEEIKALASKWWGNGILPQHYFDALKEAAKLGAQRAAHGANNDDAHAEEELLDTLPV